MDNPIKEYSVDLKRAVNDEASDHSELLNRHLETVHKISKDNPTIGKELEMVHEYLSFLKEYNDSVMQNTVPF